MIPIEKAWKQKESLSSKNADDKFRAKFEDVVIESVFSFGVIIELDCRLSVDSLLCSVGYLTWIIWSFAFSASLVYSHRPFFDSSQYRIFRLCMYFATFY